MLFRTNVSFNFLLIGCANSFSSCCSNRSNSISSINSSSIVVVEVLIAVLVIVQTIVMFLTIDSVRKILNLMKRKN